jgi:hypothetical protein
VVLDNAAPGLNNPQAALSGHASVADNLYTYGENSDLTLTIDRMNSLSDNASEGGIGDSEAMGKPWTKDRLADMEWRVVLESGSNLKRHESEPWQRATVNTYTVTNTQTELFNGTTLDQETAYEVKLQFKDRMGNESVPQPTGLSVKYSTQAAMITNLTDLAAFRDMVNTNGGATAGKEYILTDDIEIAESWTPIGTENQSFQGTFYGNGHAIVVKSGFSFTDVPYTGIFGYVNDAEIRDLTLRYDVNVAAGASADRIGGLTGYAGGSTRIRNVTIQSAAGVTLSRAGGAATARYLGGIAGYLAGTAGMENCSSSLGVSLIAPNAVDLFAGGIAGYSGSSGTLKDISCTAAVSLEKTNNATGSNFCGGIGGQFINTSLDNCVFTGSVTVPTADTSTDDMFVGGLLGSFIVTSMSSPVTIKNSRAAGTLNYLSNKTQGTSNIGGLAGHMEGYNSINPAKIENSWYEGEMTVNEGANNSESSSYGGVAGSIGDNCFFTACYASSSATVEVSKQGTGWIYFGGFAGYVANISLTGAYSEAAISITSAPGAVYTYFGGLIGYFHLNDYYATRTVSGCYAKGSMSNYSKYVLYIGGLVGYAKNSSPSTLTISQCYAVGNVRAISGEGIEVAAGGLIGYGRNISVKYCYALGDVAATNICSSGGITGNINIYSGGLIGYLKSDNSAAKVLTECFASGLVESHINTTYDTVWGGGLLGYAADADVSGSQLEISKLAALGGKVTCTGGSNAYIARIMGGKNSSPAITMAGLYANHAMLLASSNTYGAYLSGTGPTADIGPSAINGDNAGLYTDFMSPSFWETTIGFSSTHWNFNTVVGKGYPTIKGLGGQ